MGEMPDWYDLIQAAKYLGVAPWELMEQSILWKHWASMAANAEAAARKQKEDAAERRAAAKRR